MGAQSSHQLPYSLYGIKLRAVRRQKLQLEPFPVFFQEWLYQNGMMISRIVKNYHHKTASRSTASQEVFKEALKGHGIKFLLKLDYQAPSAYVHRTE